MPSVEDDLEFFHAGVEDLEDYLLSDQLFWPLSGGLPSGGSLPRLTLGLMLITRQRLLARSLSSRETGRLTRLEARFEQVRSRWRAAWSRKSAREFAARLNQWSNYLEEYGQNAYSHADFYPREVRLRVILQLLQAEADDLPTPDARLLEALDSLLQVKFVPGDFVWEVELRDGFPIDPYWYLYGRPKD